MMQSILLAGGGAGGGLSLISTLSGLGLTTGLEVCIDAGDFQSYIGSGQPWLDRTANNFYFFLGSGSGGTANPTFSGPAGYAPAYFGITTDTGQRFTYHGANEPFFETLHKNNASFTALMMYYHTGASSSDLLGDNDASLQNGIQINQANGILSLTVNTTASGIPALSVLLTSAPASGRWHLMAVSISEAMGVSGGFFYLDGGYAPSAANQNPFDATYLNPGTGNASEIMEIGDGGGGTLNAGYRISAMALWSRALSKSNLDSIWNQMRARFGL